MIAKAAARAARVLVSADRATIRAVRAVGAVGAVGAVLRRVRARRDTRRAGAGTVASFSVFPIARPRVGGRGGRAYVVIGGAARIGGASRRGAGPCRPGVPWRVPQGCRAGTRRVGGRAGTGRARRWRWGAGPGWGLLCVTSRVSR